MAYSRRQGVGGKDLTSFKYEIGNPSPIIRADESSSASSSSLAAKAMRASSAYRDSSLSSAYEYDAVPHSSLSSSFPSSRPKAKDSTSYNYTSRKGVGEPKQGFWGVLARKARGIIDDNDLSQQFEAPRRARHQMSEMPIKGQSAENHQKSDNPALQKGLDAIKSSLNYIGRTIGNAVEDGLTIVENQTADIIQETRKLQIKKKGSSSEVRNEDSNIYGTRQQPLMQTHMQTQMQTDVEIQLKASRDVAMAMAAKTKLLLRELKTVKADLAFAKERCGQLEEENRILRESTGKGNNTEDEDLIRLQLETLLAEKAWLAQENSVFARENRFLREIVEYHQLTMQDVVYLDESNEDVAEVYPIKVPTAINQPPVGITAT